MLIHVIMYKHGYKLLFMLQIIYNYVSKGQVNIKEYEYGRQHSFAQKI